MSAPLLVVSHPACLGHVPGIGHPECPERLQAVLAAVEEFAQTRPVMRIEAPAASRAALLRVHPAAYIDWLERQFPVKGVTWLDPDTALSPGSREAVYRAAGAVEFAVGEALAGRYPCAFCAVRPPGHHAEPERAMGFCFFNNVAVGVAAALATGLDRVAVVDFDVHHGNGTEAMFAGDRRVLLCSLFQHPLYPGSGLAPPPNGIFVPLPPGSDGAAYRRAFAATVVPALAEFAPQLVMVSAGFDAHAGDPLAGLRLEDADYAWLAARIVECARESAQGRVVSVLEGGYALEVLRSAVPAHLAALSETVTPPSAASASG